MKKDMETEILTLGKMLGIYCRAKHGADLCPACRELLALASERLLRCPREPKPPCRKCPAKCWPPDLRRRLREVMSFAGPRLPLRHPLLALKHYLKYF